jgi:hypothetical protein
VSIKLTHHEKIVCPECQRVTASCKCWEHSCERETRAITCHECATKAAK